MGSETIQITFLSLAQAAGAIKSNKLFIVINRKQVIFMLDQSLIPSFTFIQQLPRFKLWVNFLTN